MLVLRVVLPEPQPATTRAASTAIPAAHVAGGPVRYPSVILTGSSVSVPPPTGTACCGSQPTSIALPSLFEGLAEDDSTFWRTDLKLSPGLEFHQVSGHRPGIGDAR